MSGVDLKDGTSTRNSAVKEGSNLCCAWYMEARDHWPMSDFEIKQGPI